MDGHSSRPFVQTIIVYQSGFVGRGLFVRWHEYIHNTVLLPMSYFSKWRRGSSSTVNQRARSQSLDVEALERSGIRSLQLVRKMHFIHIFLSPSNTDCFVWIDLWDGFRCYESTSNLYYCKPITNCFVGAKSSRFYRFHLSDIGRSWSRLLFTHNVRPSFCTTTCHLRVFFYLWHVFWSICFRFSPIHREPSHSINSSWQLKVSRSLFIERVLLLSSFTKCLTQHTQIMYYRNLF